MLDLNNYWSSPSLGQNFNLGNNIPLNTASNSNFDLSGWKSSWTDWSNHPFGQNFTLGSGNMLGGFNAQSQNTEVKNPKLSISDKIKQFKDSKLGQNIGKGLGYAGIAAQNLTSGMYEAANGTDAGSQGLRLSLGNTFTQAAMQSGNPYLMAAAALYGGVDAVNNATNGAIFSRATEGNDTLTKDKTTTKWEDLGNKIASIIPGTTLFGTKFDKFDAGDTTNQSAWSTVDLQNREGRQGNIVFGGKRLKSNDDYYFAKKDFIENQQKESGDIYGVSENMAMLNANRYRLASHNYTAPNFMTYAAKKGMKLPSKNKIQKAKETINKAPKKTIANDYQTFINYLKETGRYPLTPEQADYDYEGFFKDKELLNNWLSREARNQGKAHFDDKYKLPSHPTFSTDSKYSNEEHKGGTWKNNVFYASPFNRSQHGDAYLQEYFRKNEPNAILMWEAPEINNENYMSPLAYEDEEKEYGFYKEGGKIEEYQVSDTPNLIPEGALHARLHHMENAEGLTKKGIPVVAEEGGKMEQQAEIERNEIVFNKEVTEKLEHLYKIYNSDSYSQKEKDEAALEAGKMLSIEIVENTEDRTGLMQQVEG